MRTKLLLLACVALALVTIVGGTACNEHELSPFSNSLSAGNAELNKDGAIRTVDILFVVDDSNSMVEEQRGLDANFTKFLKRLTNVNADFQLAVVSTSLKVGNVNNGVMLPEANIWFNTILGTAFTSTIFTNEDGSTITAAELLGKCSSFFKTTNRNWVASTDRYKYDKASKAWMVSNENMSSQDIQDIFRCQGLTGTAGSAVERGLSTMIRSLKSNRNFKRSGSLLAVVFVTDENDCSSTKENAVSAISSGDDSGGVKKCELERNIEDSCILTNADRVNVDQLLLSSGPTIDVGGEMMPLRNACVEATETSIAALSAYMSNNPEIAKEYIHCPEDGCKNKLLSRRVVYDELIEFVRASNANYYYGIQPSLKQLDKVEREARERELAREDIIIASVINRDQGVRYDGEYAENWCGAAGGQGYRYQLFSEMFEQPIYAPICCRREAFSTTSETDEIEEVCSEVSAWGALSNFGPVLSAIGKRIGEAVATICAGNVPVTCNPEECKAGSPKCPCLRGCNETEYFANTEHAYHVCNEFKVVVGSVRGEDMATFTQYKEGEDYTIEMESTFCVNRTDSPIQIKLNKAEAGRTLMYQYPRKVSSAK